LGKLFAELDRQLETAGVILKRGIMLARRSPQDPRRYTMPDCDGFKRRALFFKYSAIFGRTLGSGNARLL
jgi:hypothetical protein